MLYKLLGRWFRPQRLTKEKIHAKYRNVTDVFYCADCAEEGVDTPVPAEEWSEYCHEMGFRDLDLLQPACKHHAEVRLAEDEPEH